MKTKLILKDLKIKKYKSETQYFTEYYKTLWPSISLKTKSSYENTSFVQMKNPSECLDFFQEKLFNKLQNFYHERLSQLSNKFYDSIDGAIDSANSKYVNQKIPSNAFRLGRQSYEDLLNECLSIYSDVKDFAYGFLHTDLSQCLDMNKFNYSLLKTDRYKSNYPLIIKYLNKPK